MLLYNVYIGPADGIWGAPVGLDAAPALPPAVSFLVDEMLSWCSLQPVYVQDASVYPGPADGIGWGAPVG